MQEARPSGPSVQIYCSLYTILRKYIYLSEALFDSEARQPSMDMLLC